MLCGVVIPRTDSVYAYLVMDKGRTASGGKGYAQAMGMFWPILLMGVVVICLIKL